MSKEEVYFKTYIGSKGRIIIPKEIRRSLNLDSDSQVRLKIKKEKPLKE